MSQLTQVDTLNNVTRQLYIYGYSFIVVTGVAGNTINTIMFSTKLKASVCSAYLIAYDVSNIVGILIYNVPTIIQLAYGKNGSESSVIWCRAMNCVGNICLIYGPLTLCLASIDRYLCTSRQASRREWSSMKVARISLIVASLASFALLTPDLIYWNIDHNIQRCIAENLYYQYMSYFVYPVMTCFVPLIILSAFGYKTYRNLRTTIHPTRSTGTDESHKSRMDYRWTRMILIQTLVFLVQVGIFCIIYIYNTVTVYTEKSDMRIAVENLVEAFGFIFNNTSGCISFFIYYSQSATYRADVKKMFTRERARQ